MMLFVGRGFSTQAGGLEAIEAPALAAWIRTGSDGLRSQVEMLRQAARLDPALYRRRKTHLPYFIGAAFREGIRRTDHLVAADCLILDLDGCRQSEAQFAALRERLCADAQVWLLYTSPGGQGLKLVFRLERPLTESKAFSDCYQAFARQFARRHDIGDWVDYRTHDVTRVSFLSYDPQVCFAPDAEPVAPVQHSAFIDASIDIPWATPGNPPDEGVLEVELQPRTEPQPVREPDAEAWLDIRRALRPERPVRSRQVTLPAEIEAITPAIRLAAEASGFALRETLDLNYGRKYIFAYQTVWAEVNLYHGRHGFSLVRSPKTGSDPRLAELAYDLIHRLIFDPEGLAAILA
ncbi:MAG: hypothetical protein OHK0039_41140 [Bacteroidia bacterium]